jgi:cytochrome P460
MVEVTRVPAGGSRKSRWKQPRPEGMVMASRILSIVVWLLIAGCQKAKAEHGSSNSALTLLDASGNIHKPVGYRDLYQALGTFEVVDLKDDHELHYTYASPGTAEYYRKTGKFADGTVLMKEVFAADHAQLTTGDAHWASRTTVWFIMFKDEKGRYPGNPLWGDGWGWALYKSDAPDKQVATNYKKDCLGCHIPAQATDWVYVQGYPVLKST